MFWHFKLSRIIILLFYGGNKHEPNRDGTYGTSTAFQYTECWRTLCTFSWTCVCKKSFQRSQETCSGHDFEPERWWSQLPDGGSHWARKFYCRWWSPWWRDCWVRLWSHTCWEYSRWKMETTRSQEWSGLPA